MDSFTGWKIYSVEDNRTSASESFISRQVTAHTIISIFRGTYPLKVFQKRKLSVIIICFTISFKRRIYFHSRSIFIAVILECIGLLKRC
ncbi:hypothetical protein ERO13_D09G171401v2 [Gossypium hirsutum]|uniref:Uncharacterized protein n=2 Tax=Gossypium TaxID=3633 RepID=A0A5J5Q4P0_GOSBA|nr:hypothetical protein ES319_D09G190700v1 [Gossypium barbadense]KAG4130863.1 hypothetical protein ERO13_D09G171401v2 [Gossypium hirsutum]TYI66036.1 hypothetical protein E1A91_D09G197300v1 [Gossypium mustelinum]